MPGESFLLFCNYLFRGLTELVIHQWQNKDYNRCNFGSISLKLLLGHDFTSYSKISKKPLSVHLWVSPYPSFLSVLFGAQKNRLNDTVLWSSHSLCFGWEISKIYFDFALLSRSLFVPATAENDKYAGKLRNRPDSILHTPRILKRLRICAVRSESSMCDYGSSYSIDVICILVKVTKDDSLKQVFSTRGLN